MTVIPDRLTKLDSITLAKGKHRSQDLGMCFNEAVSWLAGEPFSDVPSCVSPVLRRFTVVLNDRWDDEQRQALRPYLLRVIGTTNDGQDTARSYLALDWLIRTFMPAWLDLAGLTIEAQALRDLRRIVDLVTTEQAGPVVRAARNKTVALRPTAVRLAAGNARDAAWDAGDAAWAARLAAGNARDAAWDAAGVAAWTGAWTARLAAGDAAWDKLRPTVEMLHASVLVLLDEMIDPASRRKQRL